MGTVPGAGSIRPPRTVRMADAGMVLLETALAVPLLLALALAGLGVGRAAVDELAVVAAARDAAMQVARGTAAEEARAQVRGRVPGAEVSIGGSGSHVRVEVELRASLVPGIGAVAVTHRARAIAMREPGLR